MKKKNKQLTLLHYTDYSPLATKNLLLTILHLAKVKGYEFGILKIEKLISNIKLKFMDKSMESLVQYRLGIIPLDIYRAIIELINSGLIDIIMSENKKLLVLTEKGEKYFEEILPKLIESNLYDDVIEEIKNLHLKNTYELTELAYRRSKHLRYYVKYIGNHKIIYVFDWTDYGDGTVKPYHISMLFTFAHYDNYYMSLRNKLPDVAKVDIDSIPTEIESSELLKKKNKQKFVLLPEIFRKRHPPYLTEDKEEGKNYIANLWMIVEAINIFHTLAGIAPNADEIGCICLKDIFYGKQTNFKYISREEIKLLKEKTIKNDLKKLLEWGIIEQIKCKGEVRYKLSARKYIDSYIGKEFKVLDKNIIVTLYYRKIKPVVQPMSEIT